MKISLIDALRRMVRGEVVANTGRHYRITGKGLEVKWDGVWMCSSEIIHAASAGEWETVEEYKCAKCGKLVGEADAVINQHVNGNWTECRACADQLLTVEDLDWSKIRGDYVRWDKGGACFSYENRPSSCAIIWVSFYDDYHRLKHYDRKCPGKWNEVEFDRPKDEPKDHRAWVDLPVKPSMRPEGGRKLGVWRPSKWISLADAVNEPNFMAYVYEDGSVSIYPRIPRLPNPEGGSARIPVAVRFAVEE